MTAAQADVLEGRSPADTPLNAAAATSTTIVSVPVAAAGQYAATGKVSIVNWTGKEDYVRCGITLNGAVLDSATTVTGGASAPSAATVVTEAKVTTPAPNSTLKLECSHDHAIAGMKADAGAVLLVTSSTGVKGDPGPQGASGKAGITTFGVCASVNASLPTSQSCTCGAGKLISQVQSAGSCTVATQASPCSGAGFVPLPAGSGVYTGACCACQM